MTTNGKDAPADLPPRENAPSTHWMDSKASPDAVAMKKISPHTGKRIPAVQRVISHYIKIN
jgi:hypothetical protein